VSTARPLRLKRQEATRLDSQQAIVNPYIKVWVDTSVSHLDGTFDYLVPERLSDQVRPGIRIGVPFAGRDVEALVLERSSTTEVTNLKFISSVISPEVVAPEKLIELIAAVSKRWICNPYDLVKAAIPARVASVDKSNGAALQESTSKTAKKSFPSSVSYLQLQPHEDSLARLADFSLKESLKGSVLIVLPEERELLEMSKLLGDKAIILSSALTRTERYANYLAGLKTENAIVIGTRSSIFITPRDLRTLIIYRENSQSHYEVRHPGWNVRDIALMRADTESLNLHFVGYSPSLEMAALIESGGAKYLSKKMRLQVKTFTPQNSELLPERIFTPIRSALKNGPVLFLVSKKGYASALMCKKCKNIAICSCGGKLSRRNQSSPPECVHCSKTYPTWSCSWCNEDKLILLGRGSIRHAEEIGRAFPGFAVINSDADGVTKEISDQRSLVIATAGMAPRYAAGYSAVVLLEGASFFSYSDLRGQERSREAFFEAASKVRNGGEVLIAIDSGHPIVASLETWSPAHMYKRELTELESLNLPPFYRSLFLDVPIKEASAIAEGLRRSLLEQRIPDSSRILGPAIRNPETARVLITASISDFPPLTEFLSEYVKHRAITKKSPIELRIDPYSLS
jgi:primosomal protein N' (replication factor Y) (superfamily II helicase)